MAAASFDSLDSAPSASALQIFYATTNHTLAFARLQACTLSALDLRGTALAWDRPSYNALSPHASLADALGAWDAPPPWHPHPKMCKVLAAHRQEECRRAARGAGDADGAPLSAFGPAGRRLAWMRLYALATADAAAAIDISPRPRVGASPDANAGLRRAAALLRASRGLSA